MPTVSVAARLSPSMNNRRVVLICGAPGSGKTTLAHTLGIPVYDLDDPQWHGTERLFRDALRALNLDPAAQAAVIRCAPTRSARSKAVALCGATEVVVLETDLRTCIERITERRRVDPPLRTQIAAAQSWWKTYEPGDASSSPTPGPLATSRAW